MMMMMMMDFPSTLRL